jgi:hypothetical protein
MRHLIRLLVGSVLVTGLAALLVGPGNVAMLFYMFLLCIPFTLGLVNLLVLTVAYLLGWMVVEIYQGARTTLAQRRA